MGIIHFQETLIEKALETINDAQDLSDVVKDLKEVQIGLEQVRYSNLLREVSDSEKLRKLQQARMLDNNLRRKYPTIEIMLTLADKMPKRCHLRKRLAVSLRPLNINFRSRTTMEYCAILFSKRKLQIILRRL